MIRNFFCILRFPGNEEEAAVLWKHSGLPCLYDDGDKQT